MLTSPELQVHIQYDQVVQEGEGEMVEWSNVVKVIFILELGFQDLKKKNEKYLINGLHIKCIVGIFPLIHPCLPSGIS